ncbi:MAG: hypothetical protein H6833_07775 [Planctomycetes bacterium]|nr:hypothetical protein [Planctomycetota bacterium]
MKSFLSLVPLLTLAAVSPAAPVAVRHEAHAGRTFGVIHVVVEGIDPTFVHRPDVRDLRVEEAAGRVHYPVFLANGEPLSTTSSTADVQRLELYALVRGSEPIDLTLFVGERHHHIGLVLERDPTRRGALLQSWWKAYRRATQNRKIGPGPSAVDDYLLSMLSKRFGLEPPAPDWRWTGYDSIDELLALLCGAESIKGAMQRDVFLNDLDDREVADQELPKPVLPQAVTLPELPADVAIETLAHAVPEECFYVRCGNVTRLMWLRALIDTWGTPFRDALSVGALDHGIAARLEHQLGLTGLGLTRALSGDVVKDVALIGQDPFVREGAAIGVLFETDDSAALHEILMRRRREIARKEDIALVDITLQGQRVSLLANEHSVVRSHYAASGRFHLVTTSRHMADRFLQATRGIGNLASLDEFRYARTRNPLRDDEALLIYLSDPFFRTLVSPHYRIEMTRRARAVAELELVEMARVAARGEGHPAETITDLIDGEFLPKRFRQRADGSFVKVQDDVVSDSLRGGRGSFVPVPDIAVTRATRSEVAAYETFARAYRDLWERMDPVIIAIHHELEDDVETLHFDVHVTPYMASLYGLLQSILGAPQGIALAPVPGNVLQFEVRLVWEGESLGTLGFRDREATFSIEDGTFHSTWNDIDDLPLYWGFLRPVEGGSGELTFIEMGGLISEADDEAERKAIRSAMRIETGRRPAQVRMHIADLSRSKIGPALHAGMFVYGFESSCGNARFLDTLCEQLGVAPENALTIAERILDARLVCPLGGNFEFVEGPAGPTHRSTAWPTPSRFVLTEIPEAARYPLLDSFQSLDLDFSMDERSLSTWVTLRLHRQAR